MLRKDGGQGCCGGFSGANDDEVGQGVAILINDLSMLAANALADQFH